MFIKQIRLKNFGRLTGVIRFEKGKCNVICQDNEFGKTTLMDAVLYALYNFPSGRGRNGDLKPRDRYTAWEAGDDDFLVELEIEDRQQRNLRLTADFSRQQPFKLVNLDSGVEQELTKDRPFGRRYFQMDLQSFTQCFFLRQDEREGTDRSELLKTVDAAKSSNQKETPSGVTEAIQRLSSPTLSVPEFSPNPLLIKTVLPRIETARDEVRSSIFALDQDRLAHANGIASAQETDTRIDELDKLRRELEFDVARAELDELNAALRHNEEQSSSLASRESRLAELRPFAAYDASRRPQVQTLHSDYLLARQRVEQERRTLEQGPRQELDAARQELAGLPAELSALDKEYLNKMRSLLASIEHGRSQVQAEQQRVQQLEVGLRESGMPFDRLKDISAISTALSDDERRALLDGGRQRAEAELAAVEAENAAGEARAAAAQAKARRRWYDNLSTGILVGVMAMLVVGIVLLLTGFKFIAWTLLLIAAIIGIGSFVLIGRTKDIISRNELEPALQEEVTLGSAARKLRDESEHLRGELVIIQHRHALTDDQVKEIREAAQWSQVAAPWQAAQQALERLKAENAALTRELGLMTAAARAADDTTTQDDDAAELAMANLERHLELRAQIADLESSAANSSTGVADLQADLDAKGSALIQLVDCSATAEAGSLEDKVALYLEGCIKSEQFALLQSDSGNTPVLSADDYARAVAQRSQLQAQLDALAADEPNLATRTTFDPQPRIVVQQKLAAAERELSELRINRINSFQKADQAIQAWRTKTPALQARLAQLDQLHTDALEFREATEIAHRELSSVAREVYEEWAVALNERVNLLLPVLTNRYTDMRFDPQLEYSVFSTEADRRLSYRETAHLSKGARDQLNLVMRVAVSEYLSAHVGKLPLWFDEPFAHWDDDRFLKGMDMMNNLAREHQVILLSCHHWRYDHLSQEAPQLRENLHFCTLDKD